MKKLLLAVFVFFVHHTTYAQQLAFPTAEGYGKFTKGGWYPLKYYIQVV